MAPDWVCFDPVQAAIPLLAYDGDHFDANYKADVAAAGVRLTPSSEQCEFLMPSLTRDERNRLESLWYYTREVREDTLLLDTLQTIVNMVQSYFAWDCVIVGLVEQDVYTRLATAGCPLAVLPRRESTCAHTVMHDPHTVFELSNMEDDRRFKHSPHVVAGLRAYAGTQLCLRTIDGRDEVAIGSLCIANYTPRPRMSERDHEFLRDAARLLADRFSERARTFRRTARISMLDRLRKLECLSPAAVGGAIESLLREIHKEGQVLVRTSVTAVDNRLPLSSRSIDVGDLVDSIYTDDGAIDEFVRGLHKDRPATTMYRAIAVNSPAQTSSWFVVESRDARIIFDDLDVWFVGRCCELLESAQQKMALDTALATKTRFVRSMSHQLRTPLHSIMSFSQLMREDTDLAKQLEHSGLSDDLLLKIELCGKDLLDKINDLLEV